MSLTSHHSLLSIVHELDRRPRRMRHELLLRAGRVRLGLVRHVLHRNSGKPDVTAVILGLVDQRGATAPARGTAIRGRDGRVGGTVVQLVEGGGQVVGVHELVGGVLEAHLPAVRRRGRRRDEEELAGVRQGEAVVGGVDGRVLAEVDAGAVAHDALAVPGLADADGGLLVRERDDDAPERLEGRPRVRGGRGVDERADRLEVVRAEDVRVLEVGDEEGVGGRRRLRQGREGGKVEGEGRGAGGGAAREEGGPRGWRALR